MKRAFVILLVLLLAFGSYAAVLATVSTDSLVSMSLEELLTLRKDVEAQIAKHRLKNSDLEPVEIGDFTVTILSAKLRKDRNDKDCILFDVEWSHRQDETNNFEWSFSYRAYQDGIEIDRSYSINYDYDNLDRNLRKDATMTVQFAYILNNVSSPVELEIEELMSWTDTGKAYASFSFE
jgi:hypothetical protein